MFGLRRYVKIPNNGDEFYIIQKVGGALPKDISVDPENVLNYVIVKKTADGYEFIDYENETDGFDSYKGAEQFLRAYVAANYSEIPNRWYINLFPENNNGKLVDKEGNEYDF
jgi:hypothetical protein